MKARRNNIKKEKLLKKTTWDKARSDGAGVPGKAGKNVYPPKRKMIKMATLR